MNHPNSPHSEKRWVYTFSMYAWCGILSAASCVILTLVLNFFFLSYESWLDAILYVLWSTFIPSLPACSGHVAIINHLRLNAVTSTVTAGMTGITIASVMLMFLVHSQNLPTLPGSEGDFSLLELNFTATVIYLGSVVIGSFFIGGSLGLLNWWLLRVWRRNFEI